MHEHSIFEPLFKLATIIQIQVILELVSLVPAHPNYTYIPTIEKSYSVEKKYVFMTKKRFCFAAKILFFVTKKFFCGKNGITFCCK